MLCKCISISLDSIGCWHTNTTIGASTVGPLVCRCAWQFDEGNSLPE